MEAAKEEAAAKGSGSVPAALSHLAAASHSSFIAAGTSSERNKPDAS